MLIKSILSGEEESNIIILNNTIQTSSRAILGCFIKALLKRVDSIHVILYDMLPKYFLKDFTADMRARICCYDGFTDPLHWNNSKAIERLDGNEPNLIDSECDLASFISSRVFQRIQHDQSDSGPKVAIVIDSLDRMIHISPANACRTLNYLSRPKTYLGYQVSQLVAVVHSDLLDVPSLETIHFVGQTILWISSTSSEELSALPDDSSGPVESCKILHKRKTGKILKKVQQYAINKNFDITEFSEEGWNAKSVVKSTFEFQQIDPTANLPFNLKLTEQERQARSQVKLPYMFHEKKNNKAQTSNREDSKIFYQPDDADDFDDDDPDDDLDI